MRDIKFRAWDIEENRFVPAHEGLCEEIISMDGFRMPVLTLGTREEYKEIVITQYTGLKDKNGEEIYEGDVVEHKYSPSYTKKQYIVEWDKHDTGFSPFVDNCYGDPIICNSCRCKIIGNIYENPELMEKI